MALNQTWHWKLRYAVNVVSIIMWDVRTMAT